MYQKKERGFTTVDMTVAMLVTIIFVSIMTSVLYSVYSASTEVKRTASALNYAVDIFECIGGMSFSDVTEENVVRELKSIGMTKTSTTSEGTKGKIGNSYEFLLKIEDPKGDGYIKHITLKIDYAISAKNKGSVKLERLKTCA